MIEIPGTVGAAGLMSRNNIPDGSRICEDGFIRGIEDGEIRGRWFRSGRNQHINKRIWAGYTSDHIPLLEEKMFRIALIASEHSAKASETISSILSKPGPKPCSSPDETGNFKRYFIKNKEPLSYSMERFHVKDVRPSKMRDGDMISHLSRRSHELWKRFEIFFIEVEGLMSDLCFEKFGRDPLVGLAHLVVNGRDYYLNHNRISRRWDLLVIPTDHINEFSFDEEGEE